jgi:transcriptional regulator
MTSTYVPLRFRENDRQAAVQLMRENPLATVISMGEKDPFVNHLPLLIEERAGTLYLVGHMARANPQWRLLSRAPRSLAVFNGPQTYVTPSWYVNADNVPTWNYAVVHASGPIALVDDARGIRSILDKSVAEFEKSEPKPWTMKLPEEYVGELVQAIVGFELRVERLDAKFKLSQNRDKADREGVLKGLATRKDDMSRRVRELMLREDSL